MVPEVFRPDQPSGAAVVLGAEANGPNTFIRTIAARLAALGYLAVIPDYYRGNGPSNPDDYEDLSRLHDAIAALDFRQATFDLLAAVDHAREQPHIDPDRVAVWGYCTGATLALLAACLDRRLAAAVLFYPSQPVFPELDDKRPVHPINLLWAISCPTLILYGDDDPLFPPAVRAEVERRIQAWAVPAELVTYPDAVHVFAGAMPERYRAEADEDSWRRATALVEQRLRSDFNDKTR